MATSRVTIFGSGKRLFLGGGRGADCCCKGELGWCNNSTHRGINLVVCMNIRWSTRTPRWAVASKGLGTGVTGSRQVAQSQQDHAATKPKPLVVTSFGVTTGTQMKQHGQGTNLQSYA